MLPVYRLHVFLADGWEKGPDVETLSSYSDYRRVNSVLRPFRFVERNLKTGQQMNVLQWTTIVANLPILDAAFHPPTSGARPRGSRLVDLVELLLVTYSGSLL
jgi:hypothetical protein